MIRNFRRSDAFLSVVGLQDVDAEGQTLPNLFQELDGGLRFRCGWCNEGNSGDLEHSYLTGCNQCDGQLGWIGDRDD